MPNSSKKENPIIVKILDNWRSSQKEFDKYLAPEFRETYNVVFIQDNENTLQEYDYVLVGNTPQKKTTVHVNKENIWCIIGEPDIPYTTHHHNNRKEYSRVYGCSEEAHNQYKNYILSYWTTPSWSIEKDFIWLKNSTNIPIKTKKLSWITSNLTTLDGHKYRMNFLTRLQANNVEFDLYGRGFHPIADKWDGLAPYKYSIAFENSISKYYKTEKLYDILIAEAMPLYYGSTKIYDFFPKKSIYVINPEDPHVFEKIKEISNSDMYLENKDAILEAKHLLMTKYNWVNNIAHEIGTHAYNQKEKNKKRITLRVASPYISPIRRIITFIKRCLNFIRKKLFNSSNKNKKITLMMSFLS